jgi:hypothetical protein
VDDSIKAVALKTVSVANLASGIPPFMLLLLIFVCWHTINYIVFVHASTYKFLRVILIYHFKNISAQLRFI